MEVGRPTGGERVHEIHDTVHIYYKSQGANEQKGPTKEFIVIDSFYLI